MFGDDAAALEEHEQDTIAWSMYSEEKTSSPKKGWLSWLKKDQDIYFVVRVLYIVFIEDTIYTAVYISMPYNNNFFGRRWKKSAFC